MQRPSAHHTPPLGKKIHLETWGFVRSGWPLLGRECYREPWSTGEGAAGTLRKTPCPAAGDMSGTAFTLSPQTAPVTQAQDDNSPCFLTLVSNWSHLLETLGAKQPFPRNLISRVSSERSSNILKLPKPDSDNQVFPSVTPARATNSLVWQPPKRPPRRCRWHLCLKNLGRYGEKKIFKNPPSPAVFTYHEK